MRKGEKKIQFSQSLEDFHLLGWRTSNEVWLSWATHWPVSGEGGKILGIFLLKFRVFERCFDKCKSMSKCVINDDSWQLRRKLTIFYFSLNILHQLTTSENVSGHQQDTRSVIQPEIWWNVFLCPPKYFLAITQTRDVSSSLSLDITFYYSFRKILNVIWCQTIVPGSQ